MQKSIFKSFIEKYSLGGICETSHWYSDSINQTLTALAHTETKTVILKVVLKKWEGVEGFQLALPSSTKINSMISPIGQEFVISLNKSNDRITSFSISDLDCEVICTVAEYDAFPETPDPDNQDYINTLPTDYDVEIKLTEEFISKIMKSMSAISESKDFVLMNNKKGELDMIINYQQINTNRIIIPVVTIEGKDKLNIPLAYSTPVFKSIIGANGIVKDSIFKVSNSGISLIQFDDEMFKSSYYMFPTREVE